MTIKLVMLQPYVYAERVWLDRLRKDLPDFSIVLTENTEEAEREIVDADAAYGTLPAAILRKAQRLRWLQAHKSAPPAGYYYPELTAHPVVVTNFREIYNDHIGTHVMMFVLAFARGLHYYMAPQLNREWRPLPIGQGVLHLPNTTALIIGVGGVGAETARLAAQFGIRVVGVDARRNDVPPGVSEMHRPDKMDELLPQADFVILTVPHTPATEFFFNRARFQRMKKSAFFVNVGRGKTTRLLDLAAALKAGELAGAGLDVFEFDPLPGDHPLWTMPGVILTPHTAGYGPYLNDRRYDILLDNCRRFAAGQPLHNIVDKKNWF